MGKFCYNNLLVDRLPYFFYINDYQCFDGFTEVLLSSQFNDFVDGQCNYFQR